MPDRAWHARQRSRARANRAGGARVARGASRSWRSRWRSSRPAGTRRVAAGRGPGSQSRSQGNVHARNRAGAAAIGRIDVAVHSAKDLPSETMAELEICAALPRAAVEDVLDHARRAAGFAALPNGATIATGSVRRQHQLRCGAAGSEIWSICAGMCRRVCASWWTNSWDGIVLARAGLERLGYRLRWKMRFNFDEQSIADRVAGRMTDSFPPAGRGSSPCKIRADDAQRGQLLTAINDADTMLCLRAEREFLRLLQGDCGTPVGVFRRRSRKRTK